MGTQGLEIEADQFAAALLMPREHLEELLAAAEFDIEDEGALEDLARQFTVSKATLQYRIRNLGGGLYAASSRSTQTRATSR